jgi:hypothetical protein
VYEVDIMDGIAPALASSILGGQISAWGEAMSDANAHEIIWKVGGLHIAWLTCSETVPRASACCSRRTAL